MTRYVPYLLLGLVFGFVIIKSEAASWYRIQEMFYFQSFHMYGILMSAITTAAISTILVKRLVGKNSLEGTVIAIPKKPQGVVNYPIGGFIFGLGWGLIGLCPGPMFALVGSGSIPILISLVAAIHGAWLYGFVKEWIPFVKNRQCPTN